MWDTLAAKILSLAEIADLERGYELGAPTLGVAAVGLLGRWELPLRDAETFIRLAFLEWYQKNEPPHLTGLTPHLPDVESLLDQFGGEAMLRPEDRFTLAVLWNVFPPRYREPDAYRERCRSLAIAAANAEPASRLFAEWPFFFGDEPDIRGPRNYIEIELHARYRGRGELGRYLIHTLGTSLRPLGRRNLDV